MVYDPNASRRGGRRKHLVETVIKVVEAHKNGKNSAACMDEILLAVRKYQKDNGGKNDKGLDRRQYKKSSRNVG